MTIIRVRDKFKGRTVCYKDLGGCYRHEHVHIDFSPTGTGKPVCMGGSGPPPAGGWTYPPGSPRLVAFKAELRRHTTCGRFPHIFFGSGYNCRNIAGSSSASQHAFANALDIQSDDWSARYKFLDPVWEWLNGPWQFPGRVLKSGDKGPDVLQLKGQLSSRGYDDPHIDLSTNVYGSATVANVKEAQGDNGLAVDGVTGAKTWGALFPM